MILKKKRAYVFVNKMHVIFRLAWFVEINVSKMADFHSFFCKKSGKRSISSVWTMKSVGYRIIAIPNNEIR